MKASSISAGLIAKVFLVWAGLGVALYLAYRIRSAIGLVVISAFIAVALGPPVDYFTTRARMPRWLAILSVYAIVATLVVLAGLVVVPPIVTGVQELALDLPDQINRLQDAGWVRELNDRYDVIDRLKESAAALPDRLGSAVGTLQSITIGAFSAFVQLVTVLTLVFLMLLDGPRIVRWAQSQLPDERRRRSERIIDDIYRVVSGYVIGNLLISVAAGLVTYVTLTLLGIPFAAPLAILMAFLDLIPLVGASIAGGIIAIAAAALGDFPWDPVIWLVVLTAYQQVENNMLQPVIYRRTISVHPLLTIIAVLIGASLLGVLGVLLAIPVAAIAQVIARDLWVVWRRRSGAAFEPAPEAEA
ncbi:MAG: AI-2E family transporter [Solirubrobacterales bacterium]